MMDEVFKGDGFTVHALDASELRDLIHSKADLREAINDFLERGTDEAKAKLKFQVGHRVSVIAGPYEGMYGKVIHVSGCDALCFTDKECKVVYVHPQGGVPADRERHLYRMDDWFAETSGFAEGTLYMSFAVNELTHVD